MQLHPRPWNLVAVPNLPLPLGSLPRSSVVNNQIIIARECPSGSENLKYFWPLSSSRFSDNVVFDMGCYSSITTPIACSSLRNPSAYCTRLSPGHGCSQHLGSELICNEKPSDSKKRGSIATFHFFSGKLFNGQVLKFLF